jgi:hypothetical protein
MLKQRVEQSDNARHDTYIKQRNRKPRNTQGLFEPRVILMT